MTSATLPENIQQTFEAVANLAPTSDAFTSGEVSGAVLTLAPADCEHECAYRLEYEAGEVYVSWVTPDRYLSQSVESDLVYTGDDLDELIDEELADQEAWSGLGSLGAMDHMRNEEKLFTFRSLVPVAGADLAVDHAAALLGALAAYDAAIRQLGDMKEDEEDL